VVVAALAALACGDIGSPVRNDFYDWRLVVLTESGSDTVHFHWARSDLPVRVWVAEDEVPDLPSYMQHAVDTWEAAYLYGEFKGELVSDSSSAQVIVRGVGAPPTAEARVTRLPSALAPECRGATDLDLTSDLTQLRLPIRIYLEPRVSPDTPGLTDCLALTSIHEMGHAIGIFAHSPNPGDIMFTDPQVELPSELDLGTAEVLYHVAPTIEAVRP
jgi:hypothetical protein